jgi:hypothetical protein
VWRGDLICWWTLRESEREWCKERMLMIL